MGKLSTRRPTNKSSFDTGWDRIYGNKKQDSDSSPGDRRDACPEDLGNKAGGEGPTPWCSRPQIP